MRSIIYWGPVLALILSSTAQGAPTDPITERGQKLYTQYCSACHGAAGKGDGVVAESLKVKPADLSQIAARRDGRFDNQEVSEIIDGRLLQKVHGPREMPVWGDVLGEGPGRASAQNKDLRTTHRVAALVAYLKTLQTTP